MRFLVHPGGEVRFPEGRSRSFRGRIIFVILSLELSRLAWLLENLEGCLESWDINVKVLPDRVICGNIQSFNASDFEQIPQTVQFHQIEVDDPR